MNKTKKFAIIGRGISGLMCAIRMFEDGFQNIQIYGPEEKDGVASYAATGVFSTKGLVLARQALFKMKILGHKNHLNLVRELEKKSGIKIPRHMGSWEVFRDAKHYQSLRERIYHGDFTGCFSLKVLNRVQCKENSRLLREMEQKRDPDFFLGAFFYRNDGWFHPHCFMQSLENLVKRYNIKIYNTRIHEIDLTREKSFQLKGEGGLTFHSDHLLLANGAGIIGLLKKMGLVKTPLQLVPGQTISGHTSLESKECFRVRKKGFVAYDHEFKFGSVDHEKNQKISPSQLEIGRKCLLDELSQEFRLVPCQERVKTHFGYRVVSKDRRPVLGPVPVFDGRAKAWMFTGLYKNGYELVDQLSLEFVSMLNNEENPNSFSPARFGWLP